jgi:hypothetical protein
MDYEIGGEESLFDSSTNPSLQHGEVQAGEVKARRKREYNSDDRNRQRGVPMPEEDPSPQMG